MKDGIAKVLIDTKRFLKALSLVGIWLVLCCACMTARAEFDRDTDRVVRVGYMDYNGFINAEADGSFSGYAVDYLDEISKYTGFRYEYVFGEWSELLEKLRNKEIDLLCSAQLTAARAATFDYSAYPIGYTQGLLYTLQGNDALRYEDFEEFNGMTVGVLRASAMESIFVGYAKQNGFSCNMQRYNTEEQLLSALQAGQVDAVCSEHLANHGGLSLLANFGADAYYIISYKGSPLISKINFALQEIKTNVDFEAELYHQYYDSSTAASTVQFTRAESEYIRTSRPLTVGLMSERSPLSALDESGNPSGMMVELMEIVAKKSGLRFVYQLLEPGQTGYDFLTNCGGDLVACVASSAFSTPNPALLQSDTLQKASIVFVGRNGMDFRVNAPLTVALPEDFINGEAVVSAQYPNFSYYHCASNADCLKAIRDKKADVMLQNIYVIRECLQSPLYEDLQMLPAFSFPEEQKVVMLPENAMLMSIVNKTIAAISEEQQNDIVINNTIAKGYHASTGELMYKYRYSLIGICVLLATVVALLIAFSVSRQRSFHAIEKVNAALADSNAKLEEAVIQADHASSAKSRFLSRMSHEIRTPMNAIVGLTEIAKQHENDANKIDDCLGKISISSKVLLNIINDVLDMSAIESGKLKIAREEFDLKQILGGISSIYYPQCQSKGIRLRIVTDVANEYLLGDPLRVSQILLNLVSNAYKFTGPGGEIRITVRETTENNSKAYLRFTVSDTGCGMTEDMNARLFKPFEQETAGTAKKHGGSGLGLSITKNLVDMMHGAIGVESKKDEGTTFTVELPFDLAKKKSEPSSEAIKFLRVLVVDDDRIARDYAATVLQRIGVPYETADSGTEALIKLDQARRSGKPYDVCLVDWKMPDMDGVELTRRIRKEETSRSLVIIVSAYDLNEIQEEAIAAGADHFVTKPLFQSTVFDALMNLTNGRTERPRTQLKSYDFTGHRVLLAEDQTLNAEIAVELLGMVNMAADHAENGKIAVEKFEASAPGTYDAILMDVQMPVMDGYQATAAIRALPRPDAKAIPIYAMTANAFTEDVSAALSAGMNGHIAKPIDRSVLYETIFRAIEK